MSGTTALILALAVVLLAVGGYLVAKNKKKVKEEQAAPQAVGSAQPAAAAKPAPSAGSHAPVLQLEFTEVGNAGSKYVVNLKDRAVIGRGRDADLVVSGDPSISSKHCEVSFSGGVVYLRDLNSTNGTAVNGVPITSLYKLNLNDVLYIGKKQLRLSSVKEC